ncbi:MAG: aminotransferase class V-fold PLP-dependent enzyme, partial [Planctomycetota bacterium]
VLGTIQPVGEIGRGLREQSPDALFLVDAAQTLGHVPVDVVSDEIDLLAIAGHKGLLGPTGTGGLYVGPRAYGNDASTSRLFCDRRGGTGAVAPGLEMPETLPDALEAGTGNAVGLAGLEAAMDVELPGRHESEAERTRSIIQSLNEIPGVRTFGLGADARRMPVVLFNIEGAHPREVAAELDERWGIGVRGGTHCAPMLHDKLGLGDAGGVRASPGYRTTPEEIDRFLEAVRTLAAAVVGASG